MTHPMLVSEQQDVIMGCLDDNDISIRLQALELVSRMVTSDTLHFVVNRLITQLQTSPTADSPTSKSPLLTGLKPSADIEGDNPEQRLEPVSKKRDTVLPLPNQYRFDVLHRILDICSRDTYATITDFEWYVDVLVQLVKLVPPTSTSEKEATGVKGDVAARIGSELRNVAVRVRSVRPEAAHAAETLILLDHRATLFPLSGTASMSILEPVAWIVGEYAEFLTLPDQTLSSLVHLSNLSLPPKILSAYLQAIPKLFVQLTNGYYTWNASRQSEVALLLARITDFLEKLSSHPDLDVQERAIEFLELLRLTAEAVSSADVDDGDMPLLITSAIPSLFTGLDLNPVALGAQKKVPIPSGLDLDEPLNPHFVYIQRESMNGWVSPSEEDEYQHFYYVPDTYAVSKQPSQKEILTPAALQPASYQNLSDGFGETAEVAARRRAERRERNKDDPFYIGQGEGSSGSSTPFNHALRGANNEELDLDSIPIIDLAIEKNSPAFPSSALSKKPKRRPKPKKVEIIGDETLEFTDESSASGKPGTAAKRTRAKKSLLEVDSSGLSHLSLEEESGFTPSAGDMAKREAEEAEMAKAMAEVERLRLEMQRESERIHADQGVPAEGNLVKRKKKKKKTVASKSGDGDGEGSTVVKKKKKKVSKKQPEAIADDP